VAADGSLHPAPTDEAGQESRDQLRSPLEPTTPRTRQLELVACPNHGLMQPAATMGEPRRCPHHMDDGNACGQELLGPFVYTVIPDLL
jgi:hypothetical protein